MTARPSSINAAKAREIHADHCECAGAIDTCDAYEQALADRAERESSRDATPHTVRGAA